MQQTLREVGTQKPNAPGNITQLQALFTAIAATVGVGNIAGVVLLQFLLVVQVL